MKKKTLIISFEGPEGSGKTTVIESVRHYLESAGHSVAIFREPGATAIGEQIRSIILSPAHTGMAVATELLLYLACRMQLINEKVKPLLGKKDVIILDRFTDSTIVYQGFAGGLPIPWIKRIVKEFSGGIVPDRTFLLDVPERIGLSRSRRKDRMEQKSFLFHKKVRKGYLQLAREEPRRICRIPVKTKEHVSQAVVALVKDVLKKHAHA